MSATWRSVFDAVDVKVLPPDPDVLEAIGLSHDMTSAVADLVDNSIDAQAGHVLIRFVRVKGRLMSLLVVDDGKGMDAKSIDAAMTVGRRRRYEDQALGHFGMGLKAASFSQAETLTVLSCRASGHAVGRQWKRTGVKNFECDILDPNQSTAELKQFLFPMGSDAGTIVRWDDVRAFPAASNPVVTDEYLSKTIRRLRYHLGLVLHRILSRGSIAISIDVLDADSGETGVPSAVEPINPFGYRKSGDGRYPKKFQCVVRGRVLSMDAHIWPARSQVQEFRLDGLPEQHQGFYFYRNDRLLEAGDWKNVVASSRRSQLARVSIDITDWSEVFEMNMEKSSVHPRPEFIHAAESSLAVDGTTFKEYIEAAEAIFRQGNQRQRKRKDVVPPGAGIVPQVKRAIRDESPLANGREAVDIRWADFDSGDFFEVDRSNSTLWLNKMYRRGLLAGRKGTLNDLPVLKTLLYLLMEDVFNGDAYGPRDKDNVEIWQSVLTAAARAEIDE